MRIKLFLYCVRTKKKKNYLQKNTEFLIFQLYKLIGFEMYYFFNDVKKKVFINR